MNCEMFSDIVLVCAGLFVSLYLLVIGWRTRKKLWHILIFWGYVCLLFEVVTTGQILTSMSRGIISFFDGALIWEALEDAEENKK